MALLAAIPQSPTRFDLVKNACEETYKDSKGEEQEQLVIPPTSEIVQRRNFILDLMKTRSVAHRAASYTDARLRGRQDRARRSSPRRSPTSGARRSSCGRCATSSARSCAATPSECEKIDTGGYQVTTTLDYRMQRIVEKWVYAAAIVPNSRRTHDKILKNRGIPRSEWGWILGLARPQHPQRGRGRSSTTGPARSSPTRVGVATRRKGNKKFQPQFDVLSDGWRQPGSSIKPLVYLIGIDDQTMTAATMFMDVVTNFASRLQAFYPTQADGAERGPVRLRSALQFSLNIPAIKAGHHQRHRPPVRPVPGLRDPRS